MEMGRYVFLSHMLDRKTPSYANEYRFEMERFSAINEDAVANESRIRMPVHMGTHIDLPCHFYDVPCRLESLSADFWVFDHPLVLEIMPDGPVVGDALMRRLDLLVGVGDDIDLLLVKTGTEALRDTEKYWREGVGFSAALYPVLRQRFPKLRAFGFDTLSLSSLQSPDEGQKAHRAFLNPEAPILVIEDMHLNGIGEGTVLRQIVVAPLRIAQSDGLPCTIMAKLQE